MTVSSQRSDIKLAWSLLGAPSLAMLFFCTGGFIVIVVVVLGCIEALVLLLVEPFRDLWRFSSLWKTFIVCSLRYRPSAVSSKDERYAWFLLSMTRCLPFKLL